MGEESVLFGITDNWTQVQVQTEELTPSVILEKVLHVSDPRFPLLYMGIRTSVIGSGAINMRIEEKKPAPCLAGRWSLMPTNCVVSCSILVTPEGIIQAKSTTLAFFFSIFLIFNYF